GQPGPLRGVARPPAARPRGRERREEQEEKEEEEVVIMKALSLVACLFLLVGCAHTSGPRRDPNERPPVHVDLTAQGLSFAEQGDYVRAEQYLAGALRAGADVDRVLPSLLRVCVASE